MQAHRSVLDVYMYYVYICVHMYNGFASVIKMINVRNVISLCSFLTPT